MTCACSRLSLICILMAGFCLLSCGCLSVLTQSSQGGAVPAGNDTDLRAILTGQEADWGLSRGCVWTVTFQVACTGRTAVQNADLHVELVNAKTGAVRDTKVIFLGTIEPGGEKTVRVELDGECLDEYTVRAIPVVCGH